jgi:hypothetical protein
MSGRGSRGGGGGKEVLIYGAWSVRSSSSSSSSCSCCQRAVTGLRVTVYPQACLWRSTHDQSMTYMRWWRGVGAVGRLLRRRRLPVCGELTLPALVWEHDATVEDADGRCYKSPPTR